jgi:hypothetical protein
MLGFTIPWPVLMIVYIAVLIVLWRKFRLWKTSLAFFLVSPYTVSFFLTFCVVVGEYWHGEPKLIRADYLGYSSAQFHPVYRMKLIDTDDDHDFGAMQESFDMFNNISLLAMFHLFGAPPGSHGGSLPDSSASVRLLDSARFAPPGASEHDSLPPSGRFP